MDTKKETGDNHKKHVHHGGSSADQIDAGQILSNIKPLAGMTVLDLGCGSGHFSIAAARLVHSTGKVFALDSHVPSLDELKKRISESKGTADGGTDLNIECIAADATSRIPVPQGSVDLCIMSNILHGFVANGETSIVMKNLLPAMKKGGLLLVVDFKKVESRPGPDISERLSPEEALAELVKHASWSPRSRFEAGKNHYALLLRLD